MLKSGKFKSLLTILNEENELNFINFIRMIRACNFKDNELINKDGDLYLTVDSLIRINNLITETNNIQLRQINVKPAFHDKQYMDFSRIESELYTRVDKFNQRQIHLDAFVIYFSIRYIFFQTVMVEHVKFYSKTNTDFYQILKMIFSYDKQFICQTIIIVFLILLDRILDSDCIVNNGNILTDGRWRCYYEMGQRICRRNAL